MLYFFNSTDFVDNNLKPSVCIGGETEALIRLERYLERKAYVASFGRREEKTSHILLSCQTDLSPYLRFGCLSSRVFYHELRLIYEKVT